MLIVIATPEDADALLPSLRGWSASRLVQATMVVTAGEAGLRYERVEEGDARVVTLVEGLTDVDLRQVSTVAVAIGKGLDHPQNLLDICSAAVPVLETAIGPQRWKPVGLLVVPDAAGRRPGPTLLSPEFDPWIVVAAEDRRHPDAVNTLIEPDGSHLARHAAHALVSVAGGWTFLPLDDGDDFVSAVRRLGTATMGDVALMRAYTRVIDAGLLADAVAAEALQPGDRWPNPDVDQFDDVHLGDAKTGEITDEYLAVHAATLGLTPVEPLEYKRPRLYLWPAIVAVFRHLVARLKRLPGEWLDNRIGELYDRLAQRVEDFRVGVRVRRWHERDADESPQALLNDLAGVRLTIEPGAIGPAWSDLFHTAVALCDGGDLPSSLNLAFLVAGGRRICETDPNRIVPDPANLPSEMGESDAAPRACDPRRFDPAFTTAEPVDAEWLAPRVHTLVWLVGVGIALALAQARREAGRPSTEEWANLDAQASEVERRLRAVRRKFFTWLLVRTVLAVAGSFAVVASSLPLVGQLIGPPAIWALWLVLLGHGWQRNERRTRQIEDDAARRSDELLNRLFLALVREADVERLEQRYEEFLDWAEIIGWYLHHPFLGDEAEPDVRPVSLDLASGPAAFAAAEAADDRVTFDALCRSARNRIFHPGWLRSHYEAVRERVVSEWQQAVGSAHARAHATGFSDFARGETSLRAHLVASAREGTYRRANESRLADILLADLGVRPLAELVEAVSPPAGSTADPAGRCTTDEFFAEVRDAEKCAFGRAHVAEDTDVVGALEIKERWTTDGTASRGPQFRVPFRVGLNAIEWSIATLPVGQQPPLAPAEDSEVTGPGLV
jgi:hypothetical protein